ncbi:MAG: hypothetical protein IBX55_18905 [Methyloprofundus sp.]|nr:hypothetical protein [Methyloprofundus sp.]
MRNKTVACVIARTVSTRLPLKVLRTVCGHYTMLDFILQRLKQVKNIDAIYICTSHERVDDILEDIAQNNGVQIYRGSPDAVIERLISVGDIEEADNVIRITGDNIFTSCEYLEKQIEIHNSNNLDYTRIIDVPIGATAEVMRLSALKECYDLIDPSISEYLLLYMYKPEHYKCGVLNISGLKDCSNYTLTVDTEEDLNRTRKIFDYYDLPDVLNIKLLDILDIVDEYNIPFSNIQPSGMVKMPYGKEISYSDFSDDMKNRKNNSQKFILE